MSVPVAKGGLKRGLQPLSTAFSPDTHVPPVTGAHDLPRGRLSPCSGCPILHGGRPSPHPLHPAPCSPVCWPPRWSSRSEVSPCYSCSWWTPSVCLGPGRWPLPPRRPHHCPRSRSARCPRAGRAWRLLGMGSRRRAVVYTVELQEGFLEELNCKLEGCRGDSPGRDPPCHPPIY